MSRTRDSPRQLRPQTPSSAHGRPEVASARWQAAPGVRPFGCPPPRGHPSERLKVCVKTTGKARKSLRNRGSEYPSWPLASPRGVLIAVLVVVGLLTSLAFLRLIAGVRSRPAEVVREEPQWPATIFTSTARTKRDRWWR